MTNLKAVEFGFNKFCGPSVLSILTGKSTDECARVISKINNTYDVKGVLLTDLLNAAKQLGFKTTDMNLGQQSLFGALVSIAPKGNAQYIVTLTNHFVCVEVTDGKLYFCDNHTKEPIPAASSARLSMQVLFIHKVEKDYNYVEPLPPKPKPVYKMVYKWQCQECHNESINKNLIMHEPWCKWWGYTDEEDK